MNFQEAVIELKNGKKVKRTGWSFSSKVYIQLLDFNDSKFIYMSNQYLHDNGTVGYGIQFLDIEANDWVIVNV